MRAALVMILVGGLLVACDNEKTGAGQTADIPNASTVIERLRTVGLSIGEITVYTAETDPNSLLGRPGGYTSKADFRDTRIERGSGVDGGGSVEVYPNEDGATRRREQMQRISQSSPAIGEYTYQQGVAVLRVSRMLTPEQAAQYEQAFEGVLAE